MKLKIISILVELILLQIGIIIFTLALFAMNVWSFTLLKQEFKLATYIPSDSYAYKFVDAKERLFTKEGIATSVYCGTCF